MPVSDIILHYDPDETLRSTEGTWTAEITFTTKGTSVVDVFSTLRGLIRNHDFPI